MGYVLSAPYDDIFESFLSYEKGRGARPRGVKELRSPVSRFLSWLDEQGIDLSSLDRRVARSYLVYVRSIQTAGGEALAIHTDRKSVV